MSYNPYLSEVEASLPRVLALFDRDETSHSYGVGDRYFWAWGLIDFANGTFQGAAHGLARLWRHGLWPFSTAPDAFVRRIDAMFSATARLTRRDGSLEEAFPREGSYCVTALCAFDLLCAIDLLGEEVPAHTLDRWYEAVEPLVAYLVKADETHAIISNHLATAIAALFRWYAHSPDTPVEKKAEELLARIRRHASDEGWYKEYEGADPGYQTLGLYYLADIHIRRPDLGLGQELARAIDFLSFFAHPDGSFGGPYGSRNTRFYNPAGIEALATEVPQAQALADFMAESVERRTVVTLSSIDEPNLIPWFNAYCWAAALHSGRRMERRTDQLPCRKSTRERTVFEEAGLIVDNGPGHYTLVSIYKGGIVSHFNKTRRILEDGGVVVRSRRGQLGSTQGYNKDNTVTLDGDTIVIEADIHAMPRRHPSPLNFLVLRGLSLTLFRVRRLRECIKRLLVHLLITGRRRFPVRNTRTIVLGADLSVRDSCSLPTGYGRVQDTANMVAIHMASQGYWQLQDESS